MVSTLKDCMEYDKLVRDEVNVKELVRNLGTTEQGELTLVSDDEGFRFMLGDKDVTTPKLLEAVPRMIYKTQ